MTNASIYAAFERMRYHVVAALGNKISTPSTGSVDQILAVKTVDATGKPTEFECVDKPQDSSYTLPVATSETLGGVKPVAKTDAMTQSVGVDANGALYTASGGGSTEPTIIFDSGEITEEANLIGPIDVSGYSKIRILGKAYPSANSAGKRAAMLCFEGSATKKILCNAGNNKLFDTAGNPVSFVIYVDKGAGAWTTEAYSGYNAGNTFDSAESYLASSGAAGADGSALIYTNLYNEEQMYICAQDDFSTRPWGVGTRIMVVGDI